MKRKKRQRKNKETAIEGRKKKGKEAFGNLLMARGNFPFFSAAFSGGAAYPGVVIFQGPPSSLNAP